MNSDRDLHDINQHDLLNDFVTLYNEIKTQIEHHEREARRLRRTQAALDERYGIKKEIRMNLLNLLTLKPLTGKRSQITLVAGIVINAVFQILKALDILVVDDESIKSINETLAVIFAFFIAEKVSVKK